MEALALNPREMALVYNTFLFRGMEPLAVQAALHKQGVRTACFQAGEDIFTPRAFCRSLGVILKGSAMVRKHSPGGGGILMSMLDQGALFGAATLFLPADCSYPTEITAREQVRALLIDEAALKEMLQMDFRLTENYLAYLTGRIRFLNSRVEGLICPTAEDKLLQFLSGSADETGLVTLGLNYTALAEALCISRAALYRAMDTLTERGRIRREPGRRIYLVDAMELLLQSKE